MRWTVIILKLMPSDRLTSFPLGITWIGQILMSFQNNVCSDKPVLKGINPVLRTG